MIKIDEVVLTGGRITKGVVRIRNTVRRPLNDHTKFAHKVLNFLSKSELDISPTVYGIDEKKREVLEYIPGFSPDDLGFFTDDQCLVAAKIILSMHRYLSHMDCCPVGKTICHHDLSPCNFIFQDNIPVAIIDWDSVAIGNPIDDLAYAVWLWLDIGNDKHNAVEIARRIKLMIDAYGLPQEKRRQFFQEIMNQMHRIANSTFPTQKQTNETREWALKCLDWMQTYNQEIRRNIL